MTHQTRAVTAAMLATAPDAEAAIIAWRRGSGAEARAEQWQRAIKMYGADATHGPDCHEGGCSACILDDTYWVIYGVSRPGAEG
jgi:hypothetical protein